ncbi:hypothetical protein TREMEDRAFT_34219 [Tremella mesenterica DSM 1558]|uniref:uncharacterized protein n=1 Tax=Tremella mesenterica (strain ATCC 24925 / CBS 8224 / DSM 1558 / NBRC 9311 / NRRL Y-6157 / RJB 2259-6 / UBC 559-6) TaxID=578456 RepID=UPI0003F495C3|nr:uncharacterized protein TREMEDRAFT_34219 [Tremella mesenterica DSM 1558]EIW67032.1 hypothetical protein TREMEDRAFT_34219 [Tremella mesenterica DSM 1558]
MAYAYPSLEGTGSSTSLGREVGRRSSEGGDVLREFKNKIQEDENYISFFADRIRVEEQYIESLTRLYDRTVAVDSLQDDTPRKGTRRTARKAWTEVRDYTLREIQSREAMTVALKEDVVKALVRLKAKQTRIRLNLKDTMRAATDMYEEHARNHLPKLKRSYFQKCQALEDHKRQEHAIAMQAKLLATNSPPVNATPPTPQPEPPYSAFYHGSQAGFSPPVTNPPLPPMSNPALESPSHEKPNVTFSPTTKEKSGGRLRAGSASGGDGKTKDVLNDLATQSKKGFNAIIQRLGGDKDKDREEAGFVLVGDEGLQRRGTGRDGSGKLSGAMRGAKLKRDAEEADKAYRLGIFHLESLRIRRDKLQASAVTSLETFNDEMNVKLKFAMESYVDTMHGTAATNAQSTEVAREAVRQINLDLDMTLFRTRLRTVSTLHTAPVMYENYYVGPCKSLIFGVSLTDYDFGRGEGSDRGRPPAIVEKCIAAIDEKGEQILIYTVNCSCSGLGVEGIYRVSGRHPAIQKMIQEIEMDEEKFQIAPENEDVHTIAGVLKQYLRDLPDPVFPLPQAERVKYSIERDILISTNFAALRAKLRRLTPIHQTTFQAIIEHLSRIQSQAAVNRMDSKNLAVVFNSVLFGHDQLLNEGDVLAMAQAKDTVLEDLITFSDMLFGGDPVLPSGPQTTSDQGTRHALEDDGRPGSARTKVQIISSQSSPERRRTELAPVISPERIAGLPMASEIPVAAENSILGSVFTPDEELDLLFDPGLIPQSMRDGLSAEYHIRPLASTDLMRSHFHLLATLTSSPPIAPSVYAALFNHMKSCPSTYYIVVFIERSTDQLVASGTLLTERKHVRGGGVAGHIEDIVVSPSTQGQGLGIKMVNGLKDLAAGLGCYKVVLDCVEAKTPFYEKCGFFRKGIQMASSPHLTGPSSIMLSNRHITLPKVILLLLPQQYLLRDIHTHSTQWHLPKTPVYHLDLHKQQL